MIKVENMITNGGSHAANQFIIYSEDYITFQSYETTIARYNKRSAELEIVENWEHSQTTTRYLCKFIDLWISFKPNTAILRGIQGGKVSSDHIKFIDEV